MALTQKETMVLERVRKWARMHPERKVRMSILDDPERYPHRMASFMWFNPIGASGHIYFMPIENAVEEFFREINE